jgi:hypothetical protein
MAGTLFRLTFGERGFRMSWLIVGIVCLPHSFVASWRSTRPEIRPFQQTS